MERLMKPKRPSRWIGSTGKAARRIVLFLLLGMAANVLVAWGLGLFLDLSTATVSTGTVSMVEGGEYWTVTSAARSGGLSLTLVRQTPSWSPYQATGTPDTTSAGDHSSAWASASADGVREWLEMTFPRPVAAKAVWIHETYNPGAVDRLTTYDAEGSEVELWRGQDPLPVGSGMGIAKIDVSPQFPIQRVRIHVDSQRVPSWNEIDAVALVDEAGTLLYASGGIASSWYGAGNYGGRSGKLNEVFPSWSGLHERLERRLNESDATQRALEARGWPMLSMWGEQRTGETTGEATDLLGGLALQTRYLGPRSAMVAGPTKVLPLRPIWGGFAINSVIYSVGLWLTWLALTVPRRFVKEVGRMKRGCCIACGYELQYDFVGGCPECGWRRIDAAANSNGESERERVTVSLRREPPTPSAAQRASYSGRL